MEKRDARTLGREAQQELRNQAIRLRTQNKTYPEIAEALGVYPTTVCRWCRKYQAGGSPAIKLRARGRKAGSGRTLAPAQEQHIKGLIRDRTPEQAKLDFALWNRRAIQQLIEQEFGLPMPIRTVGQYLQRWGYTPQKPLRRAYERNPEAVNRWLKRDYPQIVAEAREQGGEIHWADETGLRSDTQHGRRRSTALISSITNQGKVRFMIHDGGMNAALMIKFMKRLIRDAGRKVFLILDNLRVHPGKAVKQWLVEHRDAIEARYLPS
jgi:transposase